MMTEIESENESDAWKKFLKKHWNMLIIFIVGAVLASIGAVLVYLWFVGDAQSTGMIPTTLGLWTMESLVTFVLHLIFWEVLFWQMHDKDHPDNKVVIRQGKSGRK